MGIWTPSGGLEVSLIIHGKMGIRYTRAKSGNFENGTLVFHSKMGIYPQNSCSGVAKWDPIFARRAYCVEGLQKSMCVRPFVRPSDRPTVRPCTPKWSRFSDKKLGFGVGNAIECH